MAREVGESRLHGDHDVADVEHDVGDEDRPDAQRKDQALRDRQLDRGDEGREQRGAKYDLRGRHREEDQEVRHRPTAELVARQGQADHRAECGRHDGRDKRDEHAVPDGIRQARSTERVEPRPERELAPVQVRPTGRVVEAEQDHHGHREDQVRRDADDVERQEPAIDTPAETRPRRRPAVRGGGRCSRHQIDAPVSSSVPRSRA